MLRLNVSDNIYESEVMFVSHLFSLTPSIKVQRSAFDRSHTYKCTFNAGKLVP